MSSAGFTGETHLLSSERLDNITEGTENVKDFFSRRAEKEPGEGESSFSARSRDIRRVK